MRIWYIFMTLIMGIFLILGIQRGDSIGSYATVLIMFVMYLLSAVIRIYRKRKKKLRKKNNNGGN